MTSIEQRLTRIEAHLGIGKAEQPQRLDMIDMRKLNFRNKFGTLDRFTYTDGVPYVQRELAVGEVIRVVDHFTGLIHEISSVEVDDDDNSNAEQPQEKERTFEAFYVDCTREEYPEVKRILEAQGYEPKYTEWLDGEDCVTTNDDGYYMTYAMCDKCDNDPIYTLPQLREKFGVEQPKKDMSVQHEPVFQKVSDTLRDKLNLQPQEQLRDFVVPLAHATLTREEVAARCIAAAEKKGYKAAPEPEWSTLVGSDESGTKGNHFFTNADGSGYEFHNHDCAPHPLTTLESFEEYCGVEQPQQYVGFADERAEPQVHGIVNTLDAPPKSKTRLEWLNELPDGYRERALANCKEWAGGKPTDVCLSMQEAINGMCDWSDTPEDWYFWLDVYNYYQEDQPLPPLPTGNSEKPNTHEQPAQPVYEAGFVFYGNDSELMLPDGTDLYLRIGRNHWVKETEDDAKPQPHTLTPVSHHTVGRFYALAGIEPNHLSDWRSYALCVKNEDVPYFVRPTSEYGIVSIDRIRPSYVSLNEVTPA